MTAAVAMPTGYTPPEPKKLLGARVRQSIHGKIANVVECWRENAKLEEQPKHVIDAIDVTHVVDTLLAKVLDEELQQWGGYARTDEQKSEQMKKLRDAHAAKKKQSK